MKKWQLKKLSTNEPLNEPQDLPDNWKNIFGLHASKDRLGDLSWAGHEDMGWFEVEVPDPTVDVKTIVDNEIAQRLKESDSLVAIDNIAITKGERQKWVEYRKQLQEIPMQPNYPNEVFWPTRPE